MKLIQERRAVIQYVRNRKRERVGVVVVYKSNKGELKLGWSKCHKSDRFDRTKGLHLALKTAQLYHDQEGRTVFDYDELPTGFREVVELTLEKSQRYFSPSSRPKSASRTKAKRKVAV